MSELERSELDLEELRSTLATRGVLINVVGPFVLLGIGYALRGLGILADNSVLEVKTHQFVVYLLGALALSELAVAFFLKKTMLHPARLSISGRSFAGFSTRCVTGMSVVFAVGAAPAIYGFVVYALGGTIEQFVFFILVGLVGYRFLRPGKDELEGLWERCTGELNT